MREVIITKNEIGKMIDRFFKNYLSKANKNIIYKMLRKKNIKLNDKKASPDTIIFEGDTIQLYLSDKTIDKFKEQTKIEKVP